MTAKHWATLILTLATFGAGGAPAAWGQPAPEDPAKIAEREIQQQQATLVGEGRSQRDRDEAARRLVQRGVWDSLRQAIGGSDISAQLAVARAIADAESPPPDLIDDLARLTVVNAELAEAASAALANYKDNARAIAALRDVASRPNAVERHRISAIRALGTLNDKQTAQFLVEVLLNGDTNPTVNNAAADALAEMTGLTEYGSDVAQWNAWWQRERAKTPEQFRNERRAEREVGFRLVRQEMRQLEKAIADFVFDGHRALTEEKDREAYILRCLKHPRPEFRVAGAQLVLAKKLDNQTISPTVIEQLRNMVGDSSPEARRNVAITVRAINDPGAVKPLLAQIDRERIPAVKATLIDALAPTKDITAVRSLLALLNEPSFQVMEAAARALSALGNEIANDRDLTRETAKALAQAMERTTGRRGVTRVRERLVEAMVPLRDLELLRLLFSLIPERQTDSIGVRRNAIRALATMNSADRRSDIAQNISQALTDSNSGVRLEAAIALGIVGSPTQINQLHRAMDPGVEPDEAVRDAAWKSMSSLFEQCTVQELFKWAEAEQVKKSPDRRLVACLALNKKLIPLGAAAAQDLATVQEIIGELYLDPKVDKSDLAIPYLQGALSYWEPKPGMKVNNIQALLMRAYLRSRQYKDGVQFAAARMTVDPRNEEPMGLEIMREVERLREANELPKALELLEAARNHFRKELRYRNRLEAIYNEIKARIPSLRYILGDWWHSATA